MINYPVLSLFFGFLLLIFAVMIIFNLTNNDPTIEPQLENILSSSSNSIQRFCSDPFSITSFSFTTNLDFRLFVEGQDICITYEDYIFCERMQCEILTNNLTSQQYIQDRQFICQMSRQDNLINVECQ